MERNLWLGMCFLAFIALAVVFAFAYRRLYRADRSNFHFPYGEVFEKRRHLQKPQLKKEFEECEEGLEAFRLLGQYMETHGTSPPENEVLADRLRFAIEEELGRIY